MSAIWNRLLQAIRNHVSTVTFVVIAALTLITTMSLTCGAHTVGAPSATVGAPAAANPVLMHNVSGTDNPLLLLLAAMSS